VAVGGAARESRVGYHVAGGQKALALASENTMSKLDWFRRSTWTDQDREEFNARLKRSRATNKAQYLGIQATHLAEVGLHEVAIELLDRLLTEFPERIQLASAHLQKAECLARLGQIEPAISEFRAALQAQRDFPNVRTNAWLDFAWFVVEKQQTDLYGEVLEVFKEFRPESADPFPVIEYGYWAIKAIIAESSGEEANACEFAKRALAEASRQHSGLRYHAKLGLVGSQRPWVEGKLRWLAVS
jgi:tetratricopeptide (TPR) repeat protein